MNRLYPVLPFSLGTTSMVFGNDLLENVRILSDLVNDIEIVLFSTPTLNNIPTRAQIRVLKRLADQKKTTLTIHLPTTLEIASEDAGRRKESIRLAREICLRTEEIEPLHYILHIPISPPTLVALPGHYFRKMDDFNSRDWMAYALESLEELDGLFKRPQQLLVENINYSPHFLESFLQRELCGLCLDLGHLALGSENAVTHLKQYARIASVIHIHGVVGHEEHVSLGRLSKSQMQQWLEGLSLNPFDGILTLEVFDPQDLKESLELVLEAFSTKSPFSSRQDFRV